MIRKWLKNKFIEISLKDIQLDIKDPLDTKGVMEIDSKSRKMLLANLWENEEFRNMMYDYSRYYIRRILSTEKEQQSFYKACLQVNNMYIKKMMKCYKEENDKKNN